MMSLQPDFVCFSVQVSIPEGSSKESDVIEFGALILDRVKLLALFVYGFLSKVTISHALL